MTLPVPLGVIEILPFVSVEVIELPSIVILSTSKDVIPFKSVCVPPRDTESEPIVIDELLNLELPILPESLLAAIEPANIAFVIAPFAIEIAPEESVIPLPALKCALTSAALGPV